MTESRPVLEAIALRRLLEATYNRMRVKLAPHILYTRHDEMYVDAITIEREGRPVTEPKLGTFKLAGLKIEGVLPTTFNPQGDLFEPNNPKYEGVTLLAV